ncbi:gamma DNA-directed DNA polymerase [Irpex rosettiformis]|uniref:Gamma DNA-directed DNA polymerase n=1 Tax=Irpex rosettiformis TaxID=378272 RepID=A0ACB8UDV8_9APHY|nr:gamma DNA-directed DNA polymerase [Irpex rosettiformis]
MLPKINTQLCRSSRCLHTTSPILQQKQIRRPSSTPRNTTISRSRRADYYEGHEEQDIPMREIPQRIKRNEVGVQLLSRRLHEQIFRNVSFPPPEKAFVQIAREHLAMHGLDPNQGSVLPDTGFTLPPLQGQTLDEHFYNIGSVATQPWLSLAKEFSTADLPPRPDHWNVQSGWTKYLYASDGSSYCEPVDHPEHDGSPENMLVFDVETLPAESPFAIMACAASKNAWYSWVSPWLLGETSDVQQLIPLGSPDMPRVVIGHNVSYDRARILEEYRLEGTKSRFIDTMALHVAVNGISSHQRAAWIKRRKEKEDIELQKKEALDVVAEMLNNLDGEGASDAIKKEEIRRLRQEIEESLPQLQADDTDEAEATSKRWEDITSANSLADVAKLHCGIQMDKETRDDFLTHSREEILDGIQDYLNYCSFDTYVTHTVFRKVLPAFLTACPSPVSFGGILTMGSSFLTVNEEWERYIENAERTYNELNDKVKLRLVELAYRAKDMATDESWRDDVWLSQLDWTPKVAGKSRGIDTGEAAPLVLDTSSQPETVESLQKTVPAWYGEFLSSGSLGKRVVNRILPYLLKMSYDEHPLLYTSEEKWHYLENGEIKRLPTSTKSKILNILSQTHTLPALKRKKLHAIDLDVVEAIASGDSIPATESRLALLANEALSADPASIEQDNWLRHLDWRPVKDPSCTETVSKKSNRTKVPKPAKPPPVLWPKWFWELAKPQKDLPRGTIDVTVRNRIAPLLLHLSWQQWPLFHSREHGWTFRVPVEAEWKTRASCLQFFDPADDTLKEDVDNGKFNFYKLPHKDGEKANVGSPLGKSFIKFAQDGTLTGPGNEVKDALDMNAQCSYWISARDRVMKQVVLWQRKHLNMGIDPPQDPSRKWGIIVPQVITMGTVTRRAIEKTWLTASNAKKNRVGSELKAMVRAPDGYVIVGADVDSEELWISSAMGDAQFGLHGATAIGWMTLEGTKGAGTDLHSKTASILGISRDQAKVFNYSRIYGAGMRHAILLLLQSNAGMLQEDAEKLAENLYASTKGRNTHRIDIFNRKFWFGGTESFVFNKLEEIALSDKPRTPALGCGITYALSKEYLPEKFGSDYMTSRINWVVQSSGVDYLHLLIVAMEHLTAKYNIKARYLISVHDELRYLVKEEDKYRAALALQIANLWTRCLFAYKLGMDDLPQGVAFFSAVDIDSVLRKEVDMPCVTPSQPIPIPPGESLDITAILAKTNGGSLSPDGSRIDDVHNSLVSLSIPGYQAPDCMTHRAKNAAWLRAQATNDFAEIKALAKCTTGRTYKGGIGSGKQNRTRSGKGGRKTMQVGDGNDDSLVLLADAYAEMDQVCES